MTHAMPQNPMDTPRASRVSSWITLDGGAFAGGHHVEIAFVKYADAKQVMSLEPAHRQ